MNIWLLIARHPSWTSQTSPNNVSTTLKKAIVSLKESETVLCLAKKVKIVTHTTIFNHSEAPPDISTAAVKGAAALGVTWCILRLSWFHLPWLSAWGSQSSLQFFPHGIGMKHWLFPCPVCLCALRIWYDHCTNLSGYHHCMWPFFLITNAQHLFLGSGGSKCTWDLAFYFTLCHLIHLEAPNRWHKFSCCTSKLILIHSLLERILLWNLMSQQCCILFWELNMTMQPFWYVSNYDINLHKLIRSEIKPISLIFYNRYSEFFCKNLQEKFYQYLIDKIDT